MEQFWQITNKNVRTHCGVCISIDSRMKPRQHEAETNKTLKIKNKNEREKDLGVRPGSRTSLHWLIALLIPWWRRTQKGKHVVAMAMWWWNVLHCINKHCHSSCIYVQTSFLTSSWKPLQGAGIKSLHSLSKFPRIRHTYLSNLKVYVILCICF